MKKQQPKAKSKRAVPKAKARPARAKKPAAKKRPAPKKTSAKKTSAKKTSAKKTSAKKTSAKTAPKKKPASRKPAGKKRAIPKKDWVKFVAQHGVVLASARGPVPSVAEAIAGEPIIGSWWSHPKAQVIFDALSSIDDAEDIRCFKLIDGKITFVHRAKWPALAKLADAGVLARERVASIVQEHMPTGEHRNMTTAYPDWVPEDVATAAAALSLDDAKQQLGSWV